MMSDVSTGSTNIRSTVTIFICESELGHLLPLKKKTHCIRIILNITLYYY